MAREVSPRCEPRFRVRLSALVRTDAVALPVRLLDLSRGGALAEGRCPLARATAATLICERLEIAARVAWVRGGRFGLTFERPIRATDLFFQLGRNREAA